MRSKPFLALSAFVLTFAPPLTLALPLAFTLALTFVLNGCGRDETESSSTSAEGSVADTLARERAAAQFKDHKDLARQELAPLVARENATADDLVAAAAIELVDGKPQAAEGFLARAEKADPKSAGAAYLRGQIAREQGDFKAALPHFRRAHELAPDDLPTRVCLAEALYETEDVKGAEDLYRSVVDVGLENGQLWYATAVFRLARLYSMNGREEEAEPLNQRWSEFEKRGAKAPDFETMAQGLLARVRPPKPTGSVVPPPKSRPEFQVQEAFPHEPESARELESWDVDGDVQPDLTAIGDRGVRTALRRDGKWKVATVIEGPVDLVRALDVDNDSDLDFLVLQAGELSLHLYEDDAWRASTSLFPALPSAPRDVVAVDYDHEGDIDLLLVGDFGARIWRNDSPASADEPRSFVDASEVAKLPSDRPFLWAVAEDFDGDNDVDFLLGGAQAVYLADSLRAGKFADKSRVFGSDAVLPARPVVADFDGDARPDVWTPAALWRQRADGSMERTPRANTGPGPASAVVPVDVDLDGALDLVWSEKDDGSGRPLATILLAAGTPSEVAFRLEPVVHGDGGPLSAADFDGDKTVDLAFGSSGIQLYLGRPIGGRPIGGLPTGGRPTGGRPNGNNGVLISYRGLLSNRRGVGSIVEYRAGPIYRRIYWRGEPVLGGVGSAQKLDVLRITWPNGVAQTSLDLDLGAQGGVDDPDAAFRSITEAPQQFGSCPFLYTFDGERVVFVTDVLGGTPLGLPAKPGVLVPFRHEEHVLVRGEQLAPKDGFLELHLTEELREVTFLDYVRISAVDHPAGTEIFPNERFCFPPFPEEHLHSIERPLAAVRARGSDGKDWTEALARVDDQHANPLVLEPLRFAGRAKPWFLELEFDPAAVARAPKLRLAMSGWLHWSDSTANMASAGAGLEFVPPTLQIPDGEGGWKDAGPPVGFPSGKSKTMVIDVTEILRRDDPRIRVASNLRIYWDAILLAVDGDDAPRDVRSLEPTSAKIWQRGFSAPLEYGGHGRAEDVRPERFDWNRLAASPRWNQTPGNYTRTGDCTPLVLSVDDRYAMIGAGDALTIRFDGRGLPPPREGFVRDWILFVDGWCKDADLNTVASQSIEPLPFHGMSTYPYPASERFPNTEEHRRWREEWNTRPARRWIQPLSAERAASAPDDR